VKAYEAFVVYEKVKTSAGLWDDCDRIATIHGLLDDAARDGTVPDVLRVDKIYVDEIQDYNQSETALFLKICNSDDLFLAGVRTFYHLVAFTVAVPSLLTRVFFNRLMMAGSGSSSYW